MWAAFDANKVRELKVARKFEQYEKKRISLPPNLMRIQFRIYSISFNCNRFVFSFPPSSSFQLLSLNTVRWVLSLSLSLSFSLSFFIFLFLMQITVKNPWIQKLRKSEKKKVQLHQRKHSIDMKPKMNAKYVLMYHVRWIQNEKLFQILGLSYHELFFYFSICRQFISLISHVPFHDQYHGFLING